MSIKFTTASGATVLVPGIYSNLTVEDSLLNVTAAARNVMIIGEADKGIPGSELDISRSFYTNYVDLQALYGSGPIVDAGRQLFTVQPSAVFTNSVGRVYVYQTNAATQAEKAISSPSGFGSLVATQFGEDGNRIKAQIKKTASVLPSQSFSFVPSAAAISVQVGINGKPQTPVSFQASANYPTNQASLDSGLAALGDATGGTYKSVVPASGNLTVTVAADQLTITSDTAWLSNPAADDIAIIPHSSDIVGASQENAGVYSVVSSTSTTVVMKKIRSWNSAGTADIAHVNPAAVASTAIAGAQNAYATAEVLFFNSATIANTDSPVTGSAASMEISEAAGALTLAGAFVRWSSRFDILSQSSANVGRISASASGAALTVTLTQGAFWSSIPKAGDVMFIGYGSPLAGASYTANIGFYLVTAASPTTLSMTRTDGLSPVARPAVALAGSTDAVKAIPTMISTSSVATILSSSVEESVSIAASSTLTNEVFPTDSIGGQVALKIGYFDSTASAATVTIDSQRKLTIDVTASPAIDPIVVTTLKYPTLSALVDYLNTLPGVKAEVGSASITSAKPNTLDMVQAMPIMANHATASLAGRVKNDYATWVQFFADNASILDFKAGSLLNKAGLPAAQALSFLSGGAKGGTSNAAVQAGLDAGLKVNTVQVVPLFSRDAYLDVNDGLTDENSTYTIDSINAALKAHVSTAWSVKVKKERFGLASFYGSFEASKAAAQAMNYEYTSMAFQLVRTTGADGNAAWFQPWMLQCMFAAGRSQAVLGTSMLRKAFNLLDVKHIGQEASIYSETLSRDFEDDKLGEIEEAIEAGLLVMGTVEGAGLRLISPDLSTRSRINSPTAWFYERNNVSFIFIELMQTMRSVLENYIGERTSDVSPSDIANVCENVMLGFVRNGSLIAYDRNIRVVSLGNGYSVACKAKPTEALEFIDINFSATRNI